MTESNGKKVTDKPMGSLQFFFMSLVFKLRDRSTSPLRFLEEASITPGDRVLDMLGDQRGVHRVLRPQGLLSFSDHHMKEADILQLVTQDGLFSLVETGKHTYLFARSAGS